MPSQRDDREAHIHDMKRNLYQVEGGERLKLWMEYTRLQNEDADNQVSKTSNKTYYGQHQD